MSSRKKIRHNNYPDIGGKCTIRAAKKTKEGMLSDPMPDFVIRGNTNIALHVSRKNHRTYKEIHLRHALFSFTLLTTMFFVSSANAALIYVGSWDVYDANAPEWGGSPPNGPLAYTGQEAAALVFGGTASDYQISTIDDQLSNINNQAWYDVIGTGGLQFAENYSNKYLGQYYGPTSGYVFGSSDNAASAFVRDNLSGGGFTNYAFIDAAVVPIPAAAWLFGSAMLGLMGVARRKRA